MNNRLFDAVILDLDGVITHTAELHIIAWTELFNRFLDRLNTGQDHPQHPFSREDYIAFVDGKPRYDGIVSFLDSRGIRLPYGSPEDLSGEETVCALGNRKNEIFNDLLETRGATVFPASVVLIESLKQQGIKVGVASSSKNCRRILESTGLSGLFDVRVDGEVSERLGLSGKPAPDIFTTACDRLGAPYHRAVVVEDAVSGVIAGRDGRFGLVIGVARETEPSLLLKNGADLVVKDLGEIGVEDIRRWFETGLAADQWCIACHDLDPASERTREALLTVGNGYMGTRGSMEDAPEPPGYPGTYIAGLYNRLTSEIGGREVENEDFVNAVNWLPVSFGIDDEPPAMIGEMTVESIFRRLELKTGILSRDMTVSDAKGRKTRIVSERFASMDDPHACALRYRITPLNYNGTIRVSAALEIPGKNDGVPRYRELGQTHLLPSGQEAAGNFLLVSARTVSSGTAISAAAAVDIGGVQTAPGEPGVSAGRAELSFTAPAGSGRSFHLEKRVAIYTSGDAGVVDAADAARNAVKNMPSFDALKQASIQQWARLWNAMDIRLTGDRFSQKILRLHMYHLLVSASPHNVHIDAGMTARGLHGEAYRGHIFWDELFILPFYELHFPEIARALLLYRYRRLDAARELARAEGFRGAMFPWQSGSSGREETQVVHLNPMTGGWGPDHSSLQRHVSLAIAYNTWRYWHTTGDLDFLEAFGAEMFFEICRFWADKARWDPETGRFHIDGVMGPDEFHEKYPKSDAGGVTDNAYTNLMTHWAMVTADGIFAAMRKPARQSLADRIGIDANEIESWAKIAAKLNIVVEDGVIAQFDGYFSLHELDWEHYRSAYGDIHRMDRILKKEGKSPDDYKLAKQADVLMAFYVLGASRVTQMLRAMGYEADDGICRKNVEYYLPRTSHGSTLSRVVHGALAAALGDMDTSWKLYQEALASDYTDIQGGTTGEGIHTGVMAGTVLFAMTAYGGLRTDGDAVRLEPALPPLWEKMEFAIRFRGVRHDLEITRKEAVVRKEVKE